MLNFSRRILHDLKKSTYLIARVQENLDRAKAEVKDSRIEYLIIEAQRHLDEMKTVIDDGVARELNQKRKDDSWEDSDAPERSV